MRQISMLVCVVSLVPAVAAADGTDTAVEPGGAPAPMVAPAALPAPTLGIRESGFRNGFSASIGQEFGTTNLGNDISGQLYGLDWRIGARLAPQWSAYLQTHLSLGTADINGGANSGYTGNFAAALMGERDLPAQTFVAAGGGYGVLNNPSGPMLAFRAGWYPMKQAGGINRRLNLALDARFYFVEQGGESMTMNHVAVSFGYDRF